MLVENAGGIQLEPRAPSRSLLKDHMGIPLMGIAKGRIECVVMTPIVTLYEPVAKRLSTLSPRRSIEVMPVQVKLVVVDDLHQGGIHVLSGRGNRKVENT